MSRVQQILAQDRITNAAMALVDEVDRRGNWINHAQSGDYVLVVSREAYENLFTGVFQYREAGGRPL